MKPVSKFLMVGALATAVLVPQLFSAGSVNAAYTYGYEMFANSTTTTNSGYNRNNAATYAINHATYATRNTSYAQYGSGADGGDCTNFVSQVLHDGGSLPFIDAGTYKDGSNAATADWYYYGSNVASSTNVNGRTSSWTGAHQFRTFWGDTDSGNGRHAYSMVRYTISDAYNHFDEIYSDLWKGDLVQFADSTFHTTHSTVIDSYSNGKLYISQHSDSADNYGNWFSGGDLKSIIKKRMDSGTSAWVYTVKIKYASS